MAEERDLKPGDWVRCGDRDNWGLVVAEPEGGRVRIRWKSSDGSVATKVKPVGVVREVRRPGGRERSPSDSRPPTVPAAGRALKALHRLRKRKDGKRPASGDSVEQPPYAHHQVRTPARRAARRPGKPPARETSDPETVMRLERAMQERRRKEPAPLRCCACGGTRFWMSVHGVKVCGMCHPPARPELVRAWLGEKDASA